MPDSDVLCDPLNEKGHTRILFWAAPNAQDMDAFSQKALVVVRKARLSVQMIMGHFNLGMS